MELPFPSSHTKPKRQIHFRNVKNINMDALALDLQHLSSGSTDSLSVADSVDLYNQSLSSLLDLHAPLTSSSFQLSITFSNIRSHLSTTTVLPLPTADPPIDSVQTLCSFSSITKEETHDYHFTGEKSVPTPLSCTSVLQSWTMDTGDSLQGIRPEPTDQLVVRKPKVWVRCLVLTHTWTHTS
ncbi:unnamed protein product [Arctogadus glacialis]